jgi:tRNA pseudouridine55 synthase
MNGIVNFLKPAGMTSHDAVAIFRRLSGVKRVGHTGTLDPMAVGVLPLCVGAATRLAEYFASDRKRYRCEMRLGIVTDTQDVWGQTLGEAGAGAVARVDERLLAETAARFTGALSQTPPAYSAVKVKGRKLYEYARAGEEVAAPARDIEIFELEIKRFDAERGLVCFEAECSKGAYMRKLCHDMGTALGCGAAMSGLIRMASGMFAIGDAHTVEELKAVFSEGASFESLLTPLDAPLRRFPAVRLSVSESRAFANGARVALAPGRAGTFEGAEFLCAVYGEAPGRADAFLGVGRFEAEVGALFADKVLFRL